MKYQVVIGTDGRVTASSQDSLLAGAVTEEMPEGFGGETQNDWRKVNGNWVYDPLTVQQGMAEPMQAEINAARIDYLAMMTGVEL